MRERQREKHDREIAHIVKEYLYPRSAKFTNSCKKIIVNIDLVS